MVFLQNKQLTVFNIYLPGPSSLGALDASLYRAKKNNIPLGLFGTLLEGAGTLGKFMVIGSLDPADVLVEFLFEVFSLVFFASNHLPHLGR